MAEDEKTLSFGITHYGWPCMFAFSVVIMITETVRYVPEVDYKVGTKS